METPKKKLTPSEAWLKIGKWCAYQERSQQDVRDKLYDYGLHSAEVEEMISRLIGEGFLSEERFAVAFAGGKFRVLGWGKEKIKIALRRKKVSEACIRTALRSIQDSDYRKKLEQVLEKRSRAEKEKDPFKRMYKLQQYLLSRGFESELIRERLKER